MITPKTIAQFLIGKRDAIEQIAASKGAFFLAALFIVSAGLARNYDHHILVREPLWVFGPFAMTFFSSFFIFAFVKALGGLRLGALKGIPTPSSNYFPFLRCFAMTAPLAWLYGIPVEQFTTALLATQFNFSVLLIVSFWRLALIVRVLVVLFNFTPLRAFCLISIPASIEMFFATFVKSINIVGIMGGMKLTTAENFLLQATRTVTMGSAILFAAACILIFLSTRGEIHAHESTENPPKISRATWTTAITIIALWLLASATPQKRLRNLSKFQQLIKEKQYAEAQAFTEAIDKSDFPPHRRILGKYFSFGTPFAVGVLVHHNTWPDWIREELEEDVRIWIKDLHPEIKEDQIAALFENHKDAPYLREFAEQFTPGQDLLFNSKNVPEDFQPAIGKDHSE